VLSSLTKFQVMEKSCLVFMPLVDSMGYAEGHFNRIFDYVIIPSCRAANVNPVRADSNLETVKSIVSADMVLCDLSSANTDVRYAFAIRHALDLPLALIRDASTAVDYSLSEFTISEYDESLRIDKVQQAIDSVTHAIRAGYRGEAALLKKLNIAADNLSAYNYVTPAVYTEFVPEPVIVAASVTYPDFVGEALTEKDVEKLKAGDSIYHTTHGKGVIITIKMMAGDKMANVEFENGVKLLVLGTSGIFRKIIG
jgi:hypothetical protein